MAGFTIRALYALFIALVIICRAHAQVEEPTPGTKFWLASFDSANQDSTFSSGEVFRESLGAGISKSLPRSWSFSPSVWVFSKETRQATTAEVEGYVTIAWQHPFEKAWYARPVMTLEFSSRSLYPYLKSRIEVGRKLGSGSHAVTPIVLWEAAHRTDGEEVDLSRARAGFRIPLRRGFEIAPMYDRRGGRNGVALLLFYEIPRSGRCSHDQSSQDSSSQDK